MAEKLVSPAVFTQENDLSFLPTGIGQIGAALIGPTTKGPAFRPTIVNSYQDFIDKFGDFDSSTYLPYAAKSYLKNSGTATVVRVMGAEAWNQAGALNIIATGSSKTVLATLLPINESAGEALALTGSISTSAAFTLSSSYGTVACSLDPTSPNYIATLFSTSPKISGSGLAGNYYLYRFFPVAASASAAGTPDKVFVSAYTMSFSGANATYLNAKTPYITSQLASGNSFNMFQFGRISDGTEGNYDVKVTIEDIKKPGSVPGTDYGTYSVYVRRVGGFLNSLDTDQSQEVLESYVNVTNDPSATNYILKRIGDMYSTIDANGVITMHGDYPNVSKYIYVIPVTGFDSLPANLFPAGFRTPAMTVPTGSAGVVSPSFTYVTTQGSTSTYDKRVDYGFNFYNDDQVQLLYSVPNSTGGITASFSGDFNLDNMFSHNSASLVYGTNGVLFAAGTSLSSSTAPVEMLKFAIPFQYGHDGIPYNRTRNIGTDITAANVFGFDCSTANAAGTVQYKKAVNIFSNADEYDINLMVTPGIISSIHSNVTDAAIQLCETRGDAFYIMDTVQATDSVSAALANVSDFNTSYAATYYPWVKIKDTVSKKLVWVPPSVVIPGVYSQNDVLGQEWWAPAGLTRGGIADATQTYVRLSQEDRNQLYVGRINPIASFPNVGICVWGQKTLQVKASALDRINVRRLLIAAKKYIASATKYLVFEQNTVATRSKFIGIVKPYLTMIKEKQGLYAFEVVMDDSNNTADLIDRNIMYGQIFLQPSKTAEFILIDFNVMPTGATFANA